MTHHQVELILLFSGIHSEQIGLVVTKNVHESGICKVDASRSCWSPVVIAHVHWPNECNYSIVSLVVSALHGRLIHGSSIARDHPQEKRKCRSSLTQGEESRRTKDSDAHPNQRQNVIHKAEQQPGNTSKGRDEERNPLQASTQPRYRRP